MASSMGAGKVITDGLVLFLDAGNNRSYFGTGTTWTDLSSTAITGSLTNGPTFSSANGGSLVFDGTNDYVATSNVTGLSFTICCWIKTTATSLTGTDSYQGNGIVWSDVAFDNNDFVLAILNNKASWFTGNPALTINGTTVINTGNWFYLTAVKNGSNSTKQLFVNGILEITGSSNANILNANPNIHIGGNTLDSRYFNGSIAHVSIYNRTLSSDEVLQNYESTRERFNLRGIAIDPDASLFLRTAGITDTTQQSAIDTLVLELKNAGLWSKMKAIYPFVGGTASTHKWNLKNPQDTNAAFRLTFNGGWTHASTGAKPNGTNGWANTWMVPNGNITVGNVHTSYYSRTSNLVNLYEQPIGVESDAAYTSNRIIYQAFYSGSNTHYSQYYNSYTAYTLTTARGYWLGTLSSSTSYTKTFLGGNLVATATQVPPSPSNYTTATMTIGATRNLSDGSGISFPSQLECAFATIGDGLTDAEASSLYTIVQKYQTTLGRQV